jgi:hypothetical protein
MAEVVSKLIGAVFDFFIEPFDGISIPMGFMLEPESVTSKDCLVPWSAINEKHGVHKSVL